MACMCGDLCCGSCGPAQGNYRCSQCGAWTSDGGCEFPAICRAKDKAFAEAEYQACLQDEKDAADYWASQGEETP